MEGTIRDMKLTKMKPDYQKPYHFRDSKLGLLHCALLTQQNKLAHIRCAHSNVPLQGNSVDSLDVSSPEATSAAIGTAADE
jgi:hypothetical protein